MSYPIPEEIEQNLTVTGQPRVDALCYVIRALFATRSIGWIASTDRAAWMHRPSATYLSLVVDRSNTSKDIHVVIQRHDRLLSGWLRHTPDLQEYLEIEQSETGWEHVLVDPGWEQWAYWQRGKGLSATARRSLNGGWPRSVRRPSPRHPIGRARFVWRFPYSFGCANVQVSLSCGGTFDSRVERWTSHSLAAGTVSM